MPIDLASHPHPPAFIHIQNTKLIKHKFVRYINHLFLEYHILYNNSHDALTCQQRQYVPFTPTIGGVLIIKHNKVYTLDYVTKIQSPIEISRTYNLYSYITNP